MVKRATLTNRFYTAGGHLGWVKTSNTNQEAWVHFITILTNKLFYYTPKKELPVFVSVNSCFAMHRNIEEESFSLIHRVKSEDGRWSDKWENREGKNSGKRREKTLEKNSGLVQFLGASNAGHFNTQFPQACWIVGIKCWIVTSHVELFPWWFMFTSDIGSSIAWWIVILHGALQTWMYELWSVTLSNGMLHCLLKC